MNNKTALLGAMLAAAAMAQTQQPKVTLHVPQVRPVGSAMYGSHCGRNQRQLRRDARRHQTTVQRLKGER